MDEQNQQVTQAPIPPTTPPQISPPINRKSSFVLSGILVLLILIGSVFIFGMQKNSKHQVALMIPSSPLPIATIIPNTAQTPTTIQGTPYSHKFMKFSLTLPSDIVIIEESSQSATFVKRGTPTIAPGLDGFYTHDLMILYRGKAGTTPQEALTNETPIAADGSRTTPSVQATINNAIGLRTTGGFVGQDNYYLTNATHTDPVIRVTLDFGPNDPDYNEFKSVINSLRLQE